MKDLGEAEERTAPPWNEATSPYGGAENWRADLAPDLQFRTVDSLISDFSPGIADNVVHALEIAACVGPVDRPQHIVSSLGIAPVEHV